MSCRYELPLRVAVTSCRYELPLRVAVTYRLGVSDRFKERVGLHDALLHVPDEGGNQRSSRRGLACTMHSSTRTWPAQSGRDRGAIRAQSGRNHGRGRAYLARAGSVAIADE